MMTENTVCTDSKPFLLLSTRAEDAAAAEERSSFTQAAGLLPTQLRQIRLEKGLPSGLDLRDYSGVFVGGGPFNASDESKSALQRNVEGWFSDLLDEILDTDYPFFGACYGVGLLGTAGGGKVSRKHGEDAAVIPIKRTEVAANDPVLASLPEQFHGIVGHKEAIEELPDGAMLLATGTECPVQMFRLGNNAYASQFHPELNAETFAQRLRIYSHHGYYNPGEDSRAVAAARTFDVAVSGQILRNFARIHAARRS